MKKFFKSKNSVTISLILIGIGLILTLIGFRNGGLTNVYFSESGFHIPSLELTEEYSETIDNKTETLTLDLSNTDLYIQVGTENRVKGLFKKGERPEKVNLKEGALFKNDSTDRDKIFIFSMGDPSLSNRMIVTLNPDKLPKNLTINLTSGSLNLMDTDQKLSFEQVTINSDDAILNLQNLKCGVLTARTKSDLYIENIESEKISLQSDNASLLFVTAKQSLEIKAQGYVDLSDGESKKAEVKGSDGEPNISITDGKYDSLALSNCSPILNNTKIGSLTIENTSTVDINSVQVTDQASLSSISSIRVDQSEFKLLKASMKYDSAAFSDVKAEQAQLDVDQKNLSLEGKIEGNFTINGKDSEVRIAPECNPAQVALDLRASNDGELIIDGQTLPENYQKQALKESLNVKSEINGGSIEFYFD